MTTVSKTIAVGAILAFFLSSCATGPTEVAQPTARPSASVPVEESSEPPSVTVQSRTATGTFTSIDGQTTGRVEVASKRATIGSTTTDTDATVSFFDLATPYSHLTAGGALVPRGDDPCFDTGTRAGGSMIIPDVDGSATTIMPAEVDGHRLHEILLHLDWTQVDTETETCLQPVVARAPLTWND